MNLEDERKFEQMRTVTTMVKDGVINLFGLNAMPVEDEETGLLRQMESGEFIPLSLMMGRDDAIAMIMEKQQEYIDQERERAALMSEGIQTGVPREDMANEMTPDELDEFMNVNEPQFENTPEEIRQMMSWGGNETQFYLENLVLNKDDIEEGAVDPQPARTIGRARKDLMQKLTQEKRDETENLPVTMPIRIESDSILEQTPEKRVKRKITVETVE